MRRSLFSFAKPSILSGVARLFNFGSALNAADKPGKVELDDACSTWEHWKAIGNKMQRSLDAYQKQKTKKHE